MMPTVVTYNQRNIASWEAELPILQQQLKEKSEERENARALLTPVLARLETLNAQLISVHTQISLESFGNRSHHHHGHSSYNEGITLLESRLQALRDSRDKQEEEKYKLAATIASCTKDIDAANERTAWIKKHVPAAREFLDALTNRPSALIDELKAKIFTLLSRYDEDHPAGLPLQVRMCLFDIPAKLNALTLADDKSPQVTYLRLCTFLWKMVYETAADAEFIDTLKELIESTHVAEFGDLPDSLATGSLAQDHFRKAVRANDQLLTPSEVHFLCLEQERFNFCSKQGRIQAQSCSNPHLKSKILNAFNLIDLDIQRLRQEGKDIDYHFYTRAVNDLAHIAANPQDLAAGQRLAKLTEVASGAPDRRKQVLGALAVVVGVLLIAASIAGFVMTFGGSSFASAFGVSLGLSLVSSQIALGIGSGVVSTVGLGMTFFGEQKRESGLRQGLSKELNDIKDDVLNADQAMVTKAETVSVNGAVPVPLTAAPYLDGTMPIPSAPRFGG